MESSQVLGGSDQESGNSESGWTMYIGSQICNENYGEADDGKDNENKPVCHDGGGDESDDSMASDASSGPILHELIPDEVRNTVDAGQSKCLSANKKSCKQKKKKDERRIRREKKDQQKIPPKAESAESQV